VASGLVELRTVDEFEGFTEFILRHLSVSVLISSIHCIRSASKMKTEIAKTTSHQYLRIIVSFREKRTTGSGGNIHEKRRFKSGMKVYKALTVMNRQ
jgi:hypothetical protein